MKVQESIPLGCGIVLEIGTEADESVFRLCPSDAAASWDSAPSPSVPMRLLESLVRIGASRAALSVAQIESFRSRLDDILRDRMATTRGESPRLEALLARVTDENRHEEVPFGGAVGREEPCQFFPGGRS